MRQFSRRHTRRPSRITRERIWVSPPNDHEAMLREIFEANLELRGIRAVPMNAPARRRAA